MNWTDLVSSIAVVAIIVVASLFLLHMMGSNPADILIIALVEVAFGLSIGYFMLGRFAGLSTRLSELIIKYKLIAKTSFLMSTGDKAITGDLAIIDYYMKRYYKGVAYRVEVHGNDAILFADLDPDLGIRLINSLNGELGVLNINEYRKLSDQV